MAPAERLLPTEVFTVQMRSKNLKISLVTFHLTSTPYVCIKVPVSFYLMESILNFNFNSVSYASLTKTMDILEIGEY